MVATHVVPLWQLKRRAIVQALAVCRGNVERAAALLETSRSSLYRSIRDFEIDAPEWRQVRMGKGEDGVASVFE
jgi:transcriptional regulator of acetoin/glycerol metabolism